MAACLACGAGSVASHVTALAVHGLMAPPETVHVTVPATRRPRPPGIVVHRALDLRPSERVKRGPVPATSVRRALLEGAALLAPDPLEAVLDEALRRDMISPASLLAYLSHARVAARRGVGTLRALVADRSANGVPESELERLMLRLLTDFRLPKPSRQIRYTSPTGGIRVDFVYADDGLVVEVEGRAPHWGRERWVADHDHYLELELRDQDALRFTWWHLTERRGFVAAMIGTKLGLQPVRWARPSRP